MSNIPQIIQDAQKKFISDPQLHLVGNNPPRLRPVLTLEDDKVISTQWQRIADCHNSHPLGDDRPEGVDCWSLNPTGARRIHPFTVVETVAPNWISHIAFTPSQLVLDLKRFEGYCQGGQKFTLRYGTDQSEYKRWFLRNLGIFPVGDVNWLDPRDFFAWVKEAHSELWLNPSVWAIAVQDGKIGLDIATSYHE
jgi:hypothetical protein